MRAIFDMALDGMGRQGIAATLNERGVPPFAWRGRKRKDGSTGWHHSYVGKILANSAVIGTFTPHKEEYHSDRLVRTALDPIPGYFPPVVDADTWAAVQAMRAARKPRGAASRVPAKNPLGGLLRCLCGRNKPVVRANKGKGPAGQVWAYYVCAARKEKGEGRCRVRPIPAEPLEAAVLDQLPAILRNCPADRERASKLRWEIGAIAGAISAAERSIEALLAEPEGGSLSPAIRSRLDALEARKAMLRKEVQWLQAELEQIAPGIALRRSAALANALENDDARATSIEAINAVCRSVFTHGEVDPMENVIRLYWRQGGVAMVALRGPAKARRRTQAPRTSDGRFAG